MSLEAWFILCLAGFCCVCRHAVTPEVARDREDGGEAAISSAGRAVRGQEIRNQAGCTGTPSCSDNQLFNQQEVNVNTENMIPSNGDSDILESGHRVCRDEIFNNVKVDMPGRSSLDTDQTKKTARNKTRALGAEQLSLEVSPDHQQSTQDFWQVPCHKMDTTHKTSANSFSIVQNNSFAPWLLQNIIESRLPFHNITKSTSVSMLASLSARLMDNATEFVHVEQNTTEFVHVEQNTTEFVHGEQNTTEFVHVEQNTTEFIHVEQNTTEFVHVEQNTTEFVRMAQNTTCLVHTPWNINEFDQAQHNSTNTDNKTGSIEAQYNSTSTDNMDRIRLAGQLLPKCPGLSCRERCVQDVESSDLETRNNRLDEDHARGQPLEHIVGTGDRKEALLVQVKTLSHHFFCNCDRKCIIYGDCCPDVFESCWNLFTSKQLVTFIVQTRHDTTIVPSPDNLVDMLRQHSDDADKIVDTLYMNYASCQIKNFVENTMMMFVEECPGSAEVELRDKCQGNISHLVPPVTATVGGAQVTFINEFCARCHGVYQSEYTRWTAGLVCDPTLFATTQRVVTFIEVDALLRFSLCNISFTDSGAASLQRTCYSSVTLPSRDRQQLLDSLNNNICTKTDVLLCESYLFYMDSYRNPHCRHCLSSQTRSKRESETHPNVIEVPGVKRLVCLANSGIPWPYLSPGIFLIFDVRTRHSENAGHTDSSREFGCTDEQIFDPVRHACRVLTCPLAYEPDKRECSPSNNLKRVQQTTSSSPTDWTGLSVRVQQATSPTDWTKLSVHVQTQEGHISCQNFGKEYLEMFSQYFQVSNVVVSHYQSEVADTNNTRLTDNVTRHQALCADLFLNYSTEALTSAKFILTPSLDLDIRSLTELKEFVEGMYLEEFSVTVVSLGKHDLSLCTSGAAPKHFASFSIEDRSGVMFAVVNTSGSKIYYPLHSVGYQMHFAQENTELPILSESHIFICELSTLLHRNDCSVFADTLNGTAFSTSVLKLEQEYGKDNVDIQGDIVYVCLAKASSEAAGQSRTFMVVSWTLTCVSVVCLLLMVTLYCLFPELRTLPGKMNASLAATMLLTYLSNALTFFKFHHEIVCPVVAALSHLVTMAQFGWMSGIAVNMALTFGSRSIRTRKLLLDNKMFFRYSIVVWGTSVVIVLTSVVLDLLHDDSSGGYDLSSCRNTTSTMEDAGDLPTSCKVMPSPVEFPRYGELFCTWFLGPVWATWVFVAAPFIVSYVINVVCFAITLMGLHRSSKQANKLRKKSSNRIQCLIYAKLSTAMGFAWVLSVAKNFVENNNLLRYLFMTVILLQGVILFLAFMANKRVFALVRKQIGNTRVPSRITTTETVND